MILTQHSQDILSKIFIKETFFSLWQYIPFVKDSV